MGSSGDNRVKIIPFCVPIPSTASFIAAAAAGANNTVNNDDSKAGIVGTITLRGLSAVVWFGWGDIVAGEAGCCEVNNNNTAYVGNGKPTMGSFAISMPPMILNNGRPMLDREIPTTQLLGGSSEEDMILGQQISTRLAKRVGWPIFVSCSFSGREGNSSGGGEGQEGDILSSDDDSMRQHSAALAEKEVARILLKEKKNCS